MLRCALLPRLLLAALFIVSGSLKAADPAGFLIRLRDYELLPDPAPGVVSLALPWLEIFSGAGLLVPRLQGGAALVIAFLLLLFTGALVAARLRGLEIMCACLGPVPLSNFPLHLLLNAALFAAAMFCFRSSTRANIPP